MLNRFSCKEWAAIMRSSVRLVRSAFVTLDSNPRKEIPIEEIMEIVTQLRDVFSTWAGKRTIEALHYKIFRLVSMDCDPNPMRLMLAVRFDAGFFGRYVDIV
jgi:hypothetical protein